MMNADPKKSGKIYCDRELQVIFCVTLMAVLGVSTIAPILPLMMERFQISAEEAGLVIAAFTLPGIFLMPIFGFCADRFGRKMVLIPSLLLFAAAGTVCAFIHDFKWLLAVRFLQGIGAASLGTMNLTLIGDLYFGKERLEAMGYNASVLSVGTCIYPLLGGWMALAGWNYPFLLSLLGIPAAIFVFYGLEDRPLAQQEKILPYLKNLVRGLANLRVIGLFWGVIMAFLIIYGVCLTLFPLFMRDVFNASPVTIGLYLSFMSLGTILGGCKLRNLAERFSERRLVLAGFSGYVLVCLMIPAMRNLAALLFPVFLFGMIHGFNIPSMYALLSESTASEYRGAVMSFNGLFLRLGQTLGPILMGGFYSWGNLNFAFLASAFLCLLTVIGMTFFWGSRPNSNLR